MQTLHVDAENVSVQSVSCGLLYIVDRRRRTQLPDAYQSQERVLPTSCASALTVQKKREPK